MVFNKPESDFKNVSVIRVKFAHKHFRHFFNILSGGNFNF